MASERVARPRPLVALVAVAAAVGPVALSATGNPPQTTVRVALTVPVSGRTPFIDDCGAADTASAVADAEVETHISVDPEDRRHLLAAWQQDRYPGGGARSNLVATSLDGGASWRRSLLPGLSACTGGRRLKASDPWTAIGADGAQYVSSFAVTDPSAAGGDNTLDPADYDGDSVVNRSGPHSRHWGSSVPIALDDGTYWNEKPIVTADPRRAQTLYAVWARHLMPDPAPIQATLDVAIAFSRSDDGGRTWRDPVILPGLPGTVEAAQGGLLTLPEEHGVTPLVVIGALSSSRLAVPGCLLFASRSDDGGATWSLPTPIGAPVIREAPDPESGSTVHAGQCVQVSSAVDPAGTLYATWFESAVTADGPYGSQISVARSSDGGATWTKTVAATSAQLAFLPSIAVSGDGTVGVTYCDTGADQIGDSELTTDLWLAWSADGGRTWQHHHAAGPFDLRTAPNSSGYMLGDYAGLVGLPDGFGALVPLGKPLARNGPTDIFFIRIALDR